MAKKKELKSYFEFTNNKMLFNTIDEVPSIEAIEATPYCKKFKDALIERRNKIINSNTQQGE